MNIIIRSMLVQAGVAYVQAGAGIVADSQPEREFDEATRKAAPTHENSLVAELRRKWSDDLAKTAAPQSHDRPLCDSRVYGGP